MSPLIAVVVPAFRQPQFLAGAALSALDQRPPVAVRVVVVNDGCPFATTHEIGTALALAHPDRVRYIRQANAGLPAARNAGVEEALATWPDLDAIFPLDADNLLSPGTLPALWDVLARDPGLAWASPDLEIFGAEDALWSHQAPFNTYRQLFENQTDAGTLIRRSVFDSGLRYAEHMPAFEDWLFILEAALAGFTGAPAGACGFRYRRRGHSMLMDAQRSSEPLKALIRKRVPHAYTAAALVRREHVEAPRFALLQPGHDEVAVLAAVDLEPARSSAADYVATVRASSGGTRAGFANVPPVTVVAGEQLLTWLRESSLLPGILLRAQLLLREHVAVELEVKAEPAPGVLAADLSAAADGAAHGLAVRTRDLLRASREAHRARLEIRAGALHRPPRCELVSFPEPIEPQGEHGSDRTLSNFCAHLHIDAAETTFPWSGGERGRAIWFIGADGDDAILSSSAALDASDGEATLHLLAVGQAGLRADPAAISHFATITMLTEHEAEPALIARIVRGADVVVHGDVPRALDTLPHLERGSLHLALVGAGDAPDAADAEPLLDGHLVTSEALGRQLRNLGVPAEKVSLLRAHALSDAIRLAGAHRA